MRDPNPERPPPVLQRRQRHTVAQAKRLLRKTTACIAPAVAFSRQHRVVESYHPCGSVSAPNSRFSGASCTTLLPPGRLRSHPVLRVTLTVRHHSGIVSVRGGACNTERRRNYNGSDTGGSFE